MASEDIYTEFIIGLYKNPMNFGTIDKPDYTAEIYNPTCGDMITLFIKMKGGVVDDVKYSGRGCAISQASASLFTEFLKGKTWEELERINKKDVLDLIRIDLSRNPTRMRCALLPLDALRKAIGK